MSRNTHSERKPRPSRTGFGERIKLNRFFLLGLKNPRRSAAGFFKKTMLFIFFLLSAVASFGELRADEARPKAPPFELVSLKGEEITQENLIGKATLVVFWASWCGTCQNELPKIARLQKKLEGKAFQVFAIGFKDTRKNIGRYVESHKKAFPFPVFYDTRNQVSRRFGARVTPTLFLFDKKGELVVPFQGGGLLDHPQFQKVLEDIL